MADFLAGKTALVTGAGGTLGASHARAMAAHGAHVVIHDIRPDAAGEVADSLQGAGGEASTLICDITDEAALRKGVDHMAESVGGFDILVNNAGITGNNALLEDIDEDFFDRMFDIHVKGTFFATRAVLPHMKRRGGGRIVNTISGRAFSGAVSGSHYNGAKGAILGLTRAWASEFAPHGVTVNAVAPGLTPSGMTRARLGEEGLARRAGDLISNRLPTAEEISSGVLYFLTGEAAIVTGRVLNMQQPRKAEII